VFIQLTRSFGASDHHPFWVRAEAIQVVRAATRYEQADGAGSKVGLGTGDCLTFCEPPEEVLRLCAQAGVETLMQVK